MGNEFFDTGFVSLNIISARAQTCLTSFTGYTSPMTESELNFMHIAHVVSMPYKLLINE